MIFNLAAGGTYNLNSSIGSTDTTLTLSSFTVPVSGTLITMVLLNTSIFYFTIAPRTTSSEFCSATGITQNADGTATITGITRGLNKTYPFTSDVAFKIPHSGNSIVILSDVPQIFNKFASLDNDETFAGLITFDQPPIGINPGGQPDASTSTKGVTKISVAPLSSTSPISVGDNDYRVNPNNYAADAGANDTYVITLANVPISYVTGQIFQFKANTANTGACTLNVNSLGALALKVYGLDPRDNYIKAASFVTVIYNGTNFSILSVSAQPQVSQDGSEIYVTTGGSANAYTATMVPVIAALTTGLTLNLTANFTNTGASTLIVNGLTAKNITKNGTNALGSGDILSGQTFTVRYDGTQFQLTSPTSANINLISSTTTPTTFSNSSAENTLISVTVPGGTLGTKNAVKGRFHYTTSQNSGGAVNLVLKLKYGATTIATATTLFPNGTQGNGYIDFLIIANAATNAQKASLTGVLPTNATTILTFDNINVAAIDSTADQTLVVTSQFASATNNVSTMDHYVIEKVY